MKKWIVIILVPVVFLSCTKQDIYCRVTLEARMESPSVAISIDNSLEGNYFKNINTGDRYPLPLFVNGRCEITVLKGFYMIAFDGVSAGADGTARRVRSAQYASAPLAVDLTKDSATVVLNLLEL